MFVMNNKTIHAHDGEYYYHFITSQVYSTTQGLDYTE